jgi:hypothetical protein
MPDSYKVSQNEAQMKPQLLKWEVVQIMGEWEIMETYP